jgi:branched-chain amino acid transport system substrate-binding protein/neutral amino acid transport system substrate-binding protein
LKAVKRLSLVLLLIGALALAGACGGGGEQGGGDTGGGGTTGDGGGLGSLNLKLGTILPLTGDLSQFGPGIENGVKLAVNEINACQNGLQVEGFYEDSGTNEQTAATAADKLINTNNVSTIVGAASSRISFSVIDTAAQSQVVQISPASTSPDFTDYEDNGYFFRTVPSDALQGEVLAQIASDEGYETVNVLALNDDYGQGIAQVFEESFDGEVAQNVPYDPQGTSFDSEVRKVSQGNPDAVLLVAFPETGSSIMQAASEQGLVGEVPFLFTDGLADPKFPQDAGVNLEGERGTRPAAEGPGTEHFTQAFNEQYDSEPGTFSANAYDATMLAALAAAKAGDTSGEAMKGTLPQVSKAGQQVVPSDICSGLQSASDGQDVNYEGAAGSQDMDDNGDVTSSYELWEFNAQGEVSRVRLIEPSQ